MLTEFFSLYGVTFHSFVVVLGLVVYVVASHTLRQRRHPSAAIAWVISLVLLPYIALPLYLTFGSRKIASHRPAPGVAGPSVLASDAGTPAAMAGHLARALGLPDAASFDRLVIHEDGAHALQSLREMIGSARQSVDLCSFLLGRDALGAEIVQLLIERATEGVRVRLLIDGVGFYMGGRPTLKHLRSAGAQVALFVSPFRSGLPGRTNLRNHRKMVSVDGAWLWCGGRNLAAEYFVGDVSAMRKKHAWIDLSFDVRGALAGQAQQRFEIDWAFATKGVQVPMALPSVPAPPGPAMGARLVASGPDQTEDTIYTLLVSGCFTAHARLLAVTPYFVPDPTLLMALTLAARRGVAVDLLVPRRSNHRLADIARHAALRELAAAGARIWLAPTMMHAKAVLIDNDLALVGSANLDERSLFLNYELMVAFYEPAEVQRFAQWIERHRGGATLYRPQPPGLLRELVEGMVRWVAFQL